MTPGTKLGGYEILALIGAGGMGEVYRARDTKLKRDVALKALPEAFARDAGRMLRFQREAKVLASLNHPNIAHIYGVEERALVMELVEGESPKGPLPFEEAWKVALQIADALEYAHERGVIHRDLKPANVKVTPDGVVKLLDFGLAKAFSETPDAGNMDPENSPTATLGSTVAGTVLGTAAYMAPEQAKGKRVDKRADIWSWGVVLYQLLTGERLFKGEDLADTLAQVLTKEPNLDRVPAQVQKLLRRCLEKDPKRRLRDIGEARYVADEPAPPVTAAPSRSRLGLFSTAIAGLLFVTLAILSFIHFREAPSQKAVLRYTIPAPENATSIHSFAISPDGRSLAIAAEVSGKRQLWLRPLDAVQAQPIAGTDDATYPFWSPDSRYIGFFAQGTLKKIAANGGPVQSLCAAPFGYGGSWNRDNVIVFAPSAAEGAIQRVSAAGDSLAEVTRIKGQSGLPFFLPDNRHFLFVVSGISPEKNGVYIGSLDGKEARRILPDASAAVFAGGHLLFVRDYTLMAQPFNAATGQAEGDVYPVAERVFLRVVYAPVTASPNGVLLFESGARAATSQMVWYDHGGKLLGDVGQPGPILEPAISRDGKTIAFRRSSGSSSGIWLRDVSRENERRFTTAAGSSSAPIWSPMGDRIAFGSNRDSGIPNLYQKAANGTGNDELLVANGNAKFLTQWSRDGRFIVYSELTAETGYDIFYLPMDGETARKPLPFLHSASNELFGQLSPDSHWMAYTSDESGQREVYVRPFPSGAGLWKVSINGGEQPRWRGDGKELYFMESDSHLMAVAVKAEAGAKLLFEWGPPVPLFEAHLAQAFGQNYFEYDVTADGKRFLMDTVVGSTSPPQLNVWVNWDAGLKK